MSAPARFKNRVKVSERHGAGEWAIEKVALLILMPLALWVASTALTLTGVSHDGVLAWFANGLNATLAAVTAVVFFGFASLAWKVIVEDYIHRPGNKALLLGLINIVCLLLAAASVFFIVRLATGSVPLPAGV
ncbi:MAG: succinate dehydrogenase, hydrophobic membrane anchor protein [Brevundimonas sp.]|uniref:succinate dehydrogenase, hydrophobic membrane anchor protein n=1 Tax=Brevundimonas sp. TaxID=1871086 RepID=UPI0011FCCCD8|nr:succinate dehydrogenase, hydrophobic membrane anchor protein [Brevundimonas sp.]RZJ16486.1 MAG: succinate dehydrogenase, hydrophobic membrane anchor protein [Brevundimonas sp.]